MSVHCTTAESPLSLGSTEEIKQVQQRSKLTNFWNSHSRLSRGQTWRVFSQRDMQWKWKACCTNITQVSTTQM